MGSSWGFDVKTNPRMVLRDAVDVHARARIKFFEIKDGISGPDFHSGTTT